MSEDEAARAGQNAENDDVEAHRRLIHAGDEGKTEGEESDDDFEAHRARANQTRPT